MADPREDILARLQTVLAGVSGMTGCERNPVNLSDGDYPHAVLFDGDEAPRGDTPENQKPAKAAAPIMVMRPEIWIRDSKASAEIGTTMNAHRAAVIKAVLTDATLAALTYNGTGVHYEGAATGFTKDRKTLGEVAVNFSLEYLLKPAGL